MAEKPPVTLDSTITGVKNIAGVAKTMADRGASAVDGYSDLLGGLQKTMVSIQSGVPTGKMDAPAAATPKMSGFSGGFLAAKSKGISPSGQASSETAADEAKPEEPRSSGPGQSSGG